MFKTRQPADQPSNLEPLSENGWPAHARVEAGIEFGRLGRVCAGGVKRQNEVFDTPMINMLSIFMQALSHDFLKPGYVQDMAAGRPAKQPRTSFGERLASARENAGLTQLQLAERLGTSQRVITHWERKPVALRAEQLAALADALGVTTDFLVGRDTGKPRGQGPAGKLRRVFQKASQLPRHQQNKVAEFVEAFVNQHASETKGKGA